MEILKDFLINKGYSKIKLKFTKTNHFEIKASINGVTGRFILDTGASNSCIDINLAKKFKLTLKDSDTKAAGAGNRSLGPLPETAWGRLRN